jgi:omega-hydroxy-beta-dihydromenaquinone-9 sulfotransferase
MRLQDVHPRLVRALFERVFTYLGGMDARDWFSLLRENQFAVDRVYWPRAAYVTASSILTSLFRAREDRLYGRSVAATVVEPPLFILGLPRSGTTHLQRLLAADDRFATPTLYQTNYPHSFLSTEAHLRGLVTAWLPRTRPMDRMTQAADVPGEDERALSLLTRCSPYLGRTFPRHRHRYRRHLTFREASPEELARWKGAFVWFLKKLTWRYRRPLVLKSPPHTARVRLLLELFPDARFLHIHRHPYSVFQSAYGLRSGFYHWDRLQLQVPHDPEHALIQLHREYYDALFDDRSRIPAGRYYAVCFEDVERDPIGQLRAAYHGLDLGWPERLEPRLRRYLRSIRGYRKNVFPPLAPPLRARIAEACHRSFEAWGYRP